MRRKDWADVAAEKIDLYFGEIGTVSPGANELDHMADIIRESLRESKPYRSELPTLTEVDNLNIVLGED